MKLTRRAMFLLVCAVLTGVLGMHGLPAHGALPGAAVRHGMPAVGMAQEHHPGHGGPAAPKPAGHHEGTPSCEAAGLGTSAAAHSLPALAASSQATAEPGTAVLLATVAGNADGRSPPDRCMLCVFRI